MARMIGAAQWHPQCPYGCCRGLIPKTTVKRKEKKQWTQEAEKEMDDGQDVR